MSGRAGERRCVSHAPTLNLQKKKKKKEAENDLIFGWKRL
jgi:hypothetical protein